MPKRSPTERWQRHVMERYQAFRASEEFKALRRKGLRSLGRRKLLTFEGWNYSFTSRIRNEKFLAFAEECRAVGENFGLAQWIVEMACLVGRYQPEPENDPMALDSPRVRVVTEANDDLFIRWLLYEAGELGLYVILRRGSNEMPMIAVPVPARPEEPLTRDHRPAPDMAFSLHIETPALYPPEAAAELHRHAQQAGRELLRRLGYKAPKRLRSLEHAVGKDLRIGKKQLHRMETGDIADHIYGEGAGDDAALRRRVKDRRNKLRKRLEDYLKD